MPLNKTQRKQSPSSIESISVKEFYESFKNKLKLSLVLPPEGLAKKIKEKSINRPALALTGYFKYFARKRLQLFGAGEMAYLKDLTKKRQEEILLEIAKKNIPCIVISRNLSPPGAMIDVAKRFRIPLLRTPMNSKDFSSEATVLLEEKMAPRTSMHGTLLDIRGIGTILRGKSGVGKSECALALIERGHSLVADDLVYIKLLAEKELMGFGSKLSQGYMECRGIGIINIVEIFGIRAIRPNKRIDLIISFIEWTPGMPEERTGLDQNYYPILDQSISHVEIPVRPGRDMARLVELATMVHALKNMGHDSAKTFNQRLIDHMANKQ